MAAQPSYTQAPTFTVAEYLALEAVSDIKHEYVDGYLYAMSGGTLDHDGMAKNVRRILGNHLAAGPPGTPYVLRGPDVQLHTSPTLYYYPDALVICGQPPAGTATGLHDATLVVEALSDSTGPATDGSWTYRRHTRGDIIALDTIGLTAPLADFYLFTAL